MEHISEKDFKEVCDDLFQYTGKTKFIHVTESPANKAVQTGVQHLDQVINTMKDLPNWQLENFLVSLVKAAQSENFYAHPLPKAAAREFICNHFEAGKPSE